LSCTISEMSIHILIENRELSDSRLYQFISSSIVELEGDLVELLDTILERKMMKLLDAENHFTDILAVRLTYVTLTLRIYYAL